MKTRCRPGDLAIILRDDPGYEENIGRIVMVHGPARHDPQMGVTWLIVPVTERPYAVMDLHEEKAVFRVRLVDRIEHADAWLMPIRPDGVTMGTESECTTIFPADQGSTSGDTSLVTVPVTVTARVSVEAPPRHARASIALA